MKLNGYPLQDVKDYLDTCSFNERYSLEITAIERGIHPLEATANRMYAEAKRAEERANRRATAKAEMERADRMPITAGTAKKVSRKLARQLNKTKRAYIARVVGEKTWQALANPMTREAAISTLTEGAGQRIATA